MSKKIAQVLETLPEVYQKLERILEKNKSLPYEGAPYLPPSSTPKRFPKAKPKTEKLNKSDMPHLIVVRNFSLRGKSRMCHLKKGAWGPHLIEAGGKELHEKSCEKKRRKLWLLGYIRPVVVSKNKNKPYAWVITTKGIEAVNNYFTKLKNVPTKTKKRSHESSKNVPSSYNQGKLTMLNCTRELLIKSQPEQEWFLDDLLAYGFNWKLTCNLIGNSVRLNNLDEVISFWRISKQKEKPCGYFKILLDKRWGKK